MDALGERALRETAIGAAHHVVTADDIRQPHQPRPEGQGRIAPKQGGEGEARRGRGSVWGSRDQDPRRRGCASDKPRLRVISALP